MPAAKINRSLRSIIKRQPSLKRIKKRNRKQMRPPPKVEVPDAEIMPKGILRKRRCCPNTNITLSGKKKRKILNQIRREQNMKSKMEISTSSGDGKRKSKQETNDVTDVEMKET